MTYRRLLELITEMDDKEKDQTVVVYTSDQYREITCMLNVLESDGDTLPLGQIILT